METPEQKLVSQEVYILRPRFDPSDHLVKAVSTLLEFHSDVKHVKFYGSKEVVLDHYESRMHQFDLRVAHANRLLREDTRPINFSGELRSKELGSRTSDSKIRRVVMRPLFQTRFNTVVNQIEEAGLPELRHQPLSANHYIYFDLRPDELVQDANQRRMAFVAFKEALGEPDFVTPDQYVGHDDMIWYKEGTILEYPKPSDELEERSA